MNYLYVFMLSSMVYSSSRVTVAAERGSLPGLAGCVMPDDYREPADGEDDAPSINRALTSLKDTHRSDLCFMSRNYWLRSPIVQSNVFITWHGQGWSETITPDLNRQQRGSGTWLILDHPGFIPITISGPGSRGSVVEDVAVAEVQPGDTSRSDWKPTAYPYIFDVESTFGMVRFQNLMFFAVTDGISAHEAGRLSLDGLYGQVFDNLVKVDKSYDANRYEAIHVWPYWSQDAGVMAYTQKHLDALWLQRADTGLIDDVFVYGANAALRLDQSATESGTVEGGPASKNSIGTLHCDATRWCVWVTGFGVHFQAANIDSQGQQWTSPHATPRALSNSAAVRVDGQAVIQIGRVWQEFTDHSTFSFLNTASASNIQVGSLYEDFRYADRGPATLTMHSSTAGGHAFSVSMRPMVVMRADQRLLAGEAGTNGIVRVP